MRRFLTILAVAVVILTFGLGVAAYAYFTSTGTGSGNASTGTLQPVTVVNAAANPNSTLLPGGPAADVVLRVNNPNSRPVTLVSVTGNGTITADGSHSGCTTTGVTFTNQTGLNVPIAASTTTVVHLAGAASMSAASLSACQGATFSIPVAITVHQP
jgi:hypothetical protein